MFDVYRNTDLLFTCLEWEKERLGKMEIVQQLIRLVILLNCGVRLVTPKREINIIGFFPTSEGNVGQGVIPAVDLALAMVNDNSTLLKDYELKMYFNDSKVGVF